MANGEYVRTGVVAADPSIPFGTAIFIKDLGEFIVADRGGDIQGNRLDIFMLSRGDCFRFGRQWRKGKIIKEESI